MKLNGRLWLPTVLGMLALGGVAGCGGDDKGQGAAETPPAAEAPAPAEGNGASGGAIDVGTGKITPKSDNKKIAFIQQASQQYTYQAVQTESSKAEAKKLGYELDNLYSNLDPATELQNFNQAMSGKYAGFIMQPVNSQLCTPMKTQTLQKNVVAGVVGNALCSDGSDVGEALWAPGTAFYVGGANAVDGIEIVLNKAAEENPGPQKVAFVMGIKGHPSVVAWETAWKNFSPDHPDMELVTTVYTDFTTPGAFKATQDILQSNKDLDIIFTLYIDVGGGIAKALDAAGKTGDIKLYENGGGSKVAKKLVEQGKIAGDLPVYPDYNSRIGIQQLVAALEGKQPPKFTGGDGNPEFLETGVINKDNVASFDPQW